MKKLKIKSQKLKVKIGIFILVFLIIPFTCQGFFLDEFFENLEKVISKESASESTQIINEVRVETNTGGNVIEGGDGEIIEGEGRTEVHIKTIINDEEIEPVDIESSASEVNVESKIIVEEGKEPVVEREIQIDSEKSVENYEATVETGNKGVIKEWWSDLVDNLKTLILGIFNIFK